MTRGSGDGGRSNRDIGARLPHPAASDALVLLFAVVLAGYVAARAPLGIDYGPDVRAVDTARPQIDALARLDFGTFVREQSPLGPVSLVARAPFAVFAPASDQQARYRLGSFVCLLALALVAVGASRWLQRRGSPRWHAALAAAVVFFAPAVHQALVWGHPEELWTTALVLCAVLAAATGRWKIAAVAVGLAIGSKSWALMALPALALMHGHIRGGVDRSASRAYRAAGALRFTALAVLVAAACTAPLALADTSAFRSALSRANATAAVQPMDVWWRGSSRQVQIDLGGRPESIHRPKLAPAIEHAIRPALLALALVIALFAARRGPMGPEDALLVLALTMLARCLFDPGDQSYYHVPFVAALALWEAARRRPPVLALVASILMSTAVLRAVNSSLDSINVEYLAWSLPLLVYLTVELIRVRPPSLLHDVGPT